MWRGCEVELLLGFLYRSAGYNAARDGYEADHAITQRVMEGSEPMLDALGDTAARALCVLSSFPSAQRKGSFARKAACQSLGLCARP